MDKSVKLAKLWMTLDEIKGVIDNTAVPLGAHLSLEDPELMQALEDLSSKIEEHFKKFRLVGEPNRGSDKP